MLLLLALVLTACTHATVPPYTPPSAAAPKPYPTMDTRRWQQGSGQQDTLLLPNLLLHLDLAVHPTEEWPALAVVQHPGLTDAPYRGFVRVYDPRSGGWSAALQVDVGRSTLGSDRFARVVVAVQGNGTVHAVWGSTDVTGDVRGLQTWISQSTDYGNTWSDPAPLTTGCHWPLDMAASVDGQLVVLLNCVTDAGGQVERPAVLVRQASGTWLPRQWLDIPDWYGASGAIVLRGAGPDARAVILMTGAKPDMSPGAVYMATKYLINVRDGWEIVRRTASGDLPMPNRFRNVAGTTFDRIAPDVPARAREGMIFTFTDWDAGRVYSITSLDAGTSWGPITPIVYYPDDSPDRITHAVPSYDPVADRLVVIWTCCTDDPYAPDALATPYASWSAPGDADWQPNQLPGTTSLRVPLAFDARVVGSTAGAQTANSRGAWLGWVEAQRTLTTRSLFLNTIIPPDQYPPPTPYPVMP